jgi:hypothetical protein
MPATEGSLPIDGKPIKLNGAFHTLCSILQFVVALATEAKLGALFLNCQEEMIFKLTLNDLGHPQPKNPVHCDNATAIGIAINTIKRQQSQAMQMRFFWTCEKDAQEVYSFKWYPRITLCLLATFVVVGTSRYLQWQKHSILTKAQIGVQGSNPGCCAYVTKVCSP